jgi:hypothetical protein
MHPTGKLGDLDLNILGVNPTKEFQMEVLHQTIHFWIHTVTLPLTAVLLSVPLLFIAACVIYTRRYPGELPIGKALAIIVYAMVICVGEVFHLAALAFPYPTGSWPPYECCGLPPWEMVICLLMGGDLGCGMY